RPHPPPTLFPYTTLFRSLRDDVPLLARRANLDYASVSEHEFLTLEKTSYKFEDLASGVESRVVAQAKEAAKFRDSGIELQRVSRSEEHTSELQSPYDLVC